MSCKRLAVLAAAVLCMTCGSVNAQTAGSSPGTAETGNGVELEHIGVCGPIHETILQYGPKGSDGRLDTEPIGYEKTAMGSWNLWMPASEDLSISYAGHRPDFIRLYEFRGTLQAIVFFWDGTQQEKSAVREAAVEMLTLQKGEPKARDDGHRDWRTDVTLTVVTPVDIKEPMKLYIACAPTEDEFFDLAEASRSTAEGSAEAADADSDTPAPNPWLDRSTVNVLLQYGQPTEDPLTLENGLVGLHHADVMGPGGVPVEFWWWFKAGRAVYVAGEFLPPRGSDRAKRSFQAFSEMLRNIYGAPVEEGPDKESGGHRIVYANGPQHLILTFLEPEGDPYFRLEVYDSTQIDKLGPELRPSRSLPKRFTPPPSDSGRTKEDVRSEVGAV
jgi:hypothetical protein